jgi:hypothetical protein
MIDLNDELVTYYGTVFDLEAAVSNDTAAESNDTAADPVIGRLARDPSFRSGGTLGLINEADIRNGSPLASGIAHDNVPPVFVQGMAELDGRSPPVPRLMSTGGSSAVDRHVRNLNKSCGSAPDRLFGPRVMGLVDEGREAAADLGHRFDALVVGLTPGSAGDVGNTVAWYTACVVVKDAATPEIRRWLALVVRQLRLVWEPNVAELLPVPLGSVDNQAYKDQCVRNAAALWTLSDRPQLLLAVCNAVQWMATEALSSWYGGLRTDGCEIRPSPGKGFGLFATRVLEPVVADTAWRQAMDRRAGTASPRVRDLFHRTLGPTLNNLREQAHRLAASLPGHSLADRLLETCQALVPQTPGKRSRSTAVLDLPGLQHEMQTASKGPDPELFRDVQEMVRFCVRVERAAVGDGERRAFQVAACQAYNRGVKGSVVPVGVMRGVLQPHGAAADLLFELAPTETMKILDDAFMYAFRGHYLTETGEKDTQVSPYELICTFEYTGEISSATDERLMQRRWLEEAVAPGGYGTDMLRRLTEVNDPTAQTIWAWTG